MVVKSTNETDALKSHAETLEYRLEKHLEHLNQSIDQRDNLSLDSAWGTWLLVQKLETYLLSFAAGALIFWLGTASSFSKMWVGLVSVIAVIITRYFLEKSAQKSYFAGWQNDKARLESLPDWESRASDLWD
jgi:hypothetical protein